MRRLFYYFLLLFLFAGSALEAQIVNIESARMQSDTVGWMGGVGASFSLVKNSQQITETDIRSHIQYKTQKDIWFIIGHYGFLKGGQQKFVSNSFAHLRYNRKINTWLRWEIFVQAQDNYATNIDSRYLAGTGPRFKIADTKRFHLYMASLFMYEYEKERTKPPVIHNDIRNSSYISFTIRADRMLEIISTTFYQPLLNNFNDCRLLNETQLRARTGKHFSMIMEWNYLFDRFPAGNAPQTTYDFKTGLQYDF
jgi:Protein of unknown function, DUF481